VMELVMELLVTNGDRGHGFARRESEVALA
jgi:hypothetical protein